MIEKALTKPEQVLGAGYDQPIDGAHPASPTFGTRGYGYDQSRSSSNTKPRSIHTPADDGSLTFVEVMRTDALRDNSDAC